MRLEISSGRLRNEFVAKVAIKPVCNNGYSNPKSDISCGEQVTSLVVLI
jgi:hypothetical protein